MNIDAVTGAADVDQAKPTSAALRPRRYRRRRADGVLAVLHIEVTQDHIDVLERLGLLGTDKTEWDDVAAAVRALLDRGEALADAFDALDQWRNP